MKEAHAEAPSVAYQLLGTLNAVASHFDAALEPLGLSLAKFGALAKLVAAGEPLPLGTLAERCACVRSNITQLVDRLEAEKLVVRSDDPRDRRSIRAELTAKGRERHAEGVKAIEGAERELLARLAPNQHELFLEMLAALRGEH